MLARADEHLPPPAHARPRREARARSCPGSIDQVLFANSGAEAVENAVKLAKQAPAAARRHRLPGRLPRPHAPHHGDDRLGRALPRPHAAPRAAASTTPATATPSARRPAKTPPSTPSKTCAASCAPRSTATTWPHPGRAHPGRGRLRRADPRVLPRAAQHRRRDRRHAHHRRDPGRHGPHRQVVLPRALRRHAGHRHLRQGHRHRLPLAGHRRPPGAVGQVHARAPWAAPSAATPWPAPRPTPPSTPCAKTACWPTPRARATSSWPSSATSRSPVPAASARCAARAS